LPGNHYFVSPYLIRPARPDDAEQVIDLFQIVFGRVINEAYWRWKLWSARRDLHTAWVATVEDRIVGHYAGMPLTFWQNGQNMAAMVSVDGMVHPAHRRRGVIAQIVAACHQHWVEQGIAFTLGLPNEQWRSRKQALGWQSLFPLQWRIIPLHLEALTAGWFGLPFLRRINLASSLWQQLGQLGQSVDQQVTLEALLEDSTAVDELWHRVAPRLPLSVVRSTAWIHWRYRLAPHHPYQVLLASRGSQPVGYLVYRLQQTRRYGTIAYLPELFCDPTDELLLNTLIWRALQHLSTQGVTAALTLAVVGTPLHQRLTRAGFRFTFGAFDACITPLQQEPTPIHFWQASHWSLSGGDFDVI
jgi:predicted N-acetyltransferase YhbS